MVTKDIPYFNLEQIAESGQCFRWYKIDTDRYKIVAFGKCIEVSQEGTKVSFDCTVEDFENIWYNYFDLGTDYESIVKAVDKEDTFLSKAVGVASGIRILNQELWEMIISFIISQNNNIPRIKKSIEAICTGIGKKLDGDLYSFPSHEELLLADRSIISDAGLGYRDTYIVELCEKYSPDMILEAVSDMGYDEARKYYMTFKGIGAKVANCICLFGLHKLDACPIDTWMQKIIDEEYGGEIPGWMTGEYAGVYQQYTFYYKRYIEGKV